jgi:hypothetical protein
MGASMRCLAVWCLAVVLIAIWAPSPDRAESSSEERALDLRPMLEKQGYAYIELERLRAGYLVASVHISEHKLVFLLDTGAPNTHFDPVRTKALDLNWRRFNDEATAKVGQATESCEVNGLEIGKVKTGRLVIWSHDESEFNSILKQYGDSPVDGILGGDVLEAHAAVIDYTNRRLFLKMPKMAKGDGTRIGGPGPSLQELEARLQRLEAAVARIQGK